MPLADHYPVTRASRDHSRTPQNHSWTGRRLVRYPPPAEIIAAMTGADGRGQSGRPSVAGANNAVAAEVLERVRVREPAFLDRLVLNVLTAMDTGVRPGRLRTCADPAVTAWVASSGRTCLAWTRFTCRPSGTRPRIRSDAPKSMDSSAPFTAHRLTAGLHHHEQLHRRGHHLRRPRCRPGHSRRRHDAGAAHGDP